MSESPVYRAAVIGCGRIGLRMEADPLRRKPATHAGAFHLHPRLRLTALADPAPEGRREANRLFPGAQVFASAADLLALETPDVVAVATPPAQHREAVELCAARGVRVIVCEKPIADTEPDGRAILAACRASGSRLLINHTRRFDPEIRALREGLRASRWGAVRGGSALYTAGLYNTGTHMVDMLRFFFGEVRSVQGFHDPRPSTPAGDIAISGWLIFESGVPVSLHHLEVKDYATFDIRIATEKGAVSLDRFGFSMEEVPVRPCIDFTGYKELDVDHPVRWGESRSFMGALAEHVVAVLDGREAPVSTGRDGLEALRLLEALKASAEAGGGLRLFAADQ